MEEQKNENKSNGVPEQELSPNFAYKVIMGIIFLFFTIFFLYLLIRILTQ